MREEIEKILNDCVGFDYAWSADVDDEVAYDTFDQEKATDQILTLLDKEIRKARMEELEIMCGVATLPVRHTFEQYIADRIKQLEGGKDE